MHDLGRKSQNTEAIAMPSESKEKINYPSLSLDSAQFPEIKNWKVGKKYHLHLVVEQKGIRESYSDEGEYNVEFDILKAKAMKAGVVPEEEYKEMSSEEKDKADEKEVLGDDEE